MNFAAMILPQRVVEALGWTLFHSLWQGALAALGFAVVLYFSRRTGARLRYGLGLAALALLVLMSAFTFWSHYDAGSPVATMPSARLAGPAPAPFVATNSAQAAGEPSRTRRVVAFFSEYFGRNLPLFVTLWLLGVLFLALRFSGGMLYLQRLKYRQSRPLPSPWPERLQALAARAGLRRPLRLVESLRLRTPVVIGHLKPVLLLPVGMVTGLPADQVEALLAHELAHVVRRDYLVNVLQNLVDVLYFFHPGVRWISAAVRQEREHCCDDFAVELCGDPQNYARALARLQVGEMGYPEPGLAAVGRPRLLLRRIARLLARSRLGATVRPKLAHDFRAGFVSALLLVFGLLGILKLATAAAPVAAAAEVKPKSAPTEKSPAGRYILNSFVLDTPGTVRLIIAVPTRWGKLPSTWLVDARDGRVVWYMTLASRVTNGQPFNEEIALEAGTYGWYCPMGSYIGLERKNTDGKEPWTHLLVEPVGKNFSIHSLSETGLLLKNSQEARILALKDLLKMVEQLKRDQEMKILDEHEVADQMYMMGEEIRLLKAEQRRWQADEQHLLTVKESDLKQKEFQKLEQELQKERQAYLQQWKPLSREARLMAEAEQAQREALKADQERQAVEGGIAGGVQGGVAGGVDGGVTGGIEGGVAGGVEEEPASQMKVANEQDLMAAEKLKAEEKRREAARFSAQMRKFSVFFHDLIKKEGLVDREGRYVLKLSATTLLINGKPQSAAVHEKIMDFYESLSGKKLDADKPLTIVQEKE